MINEAQANIAIITLCQDTRQASHLTFLQFPEITVVINGMYARNPL